tara:strand:+ start:83023 stop:83469 length:447 start_codon:yes stop_codon:yes gene_type:complete
MSKSKKITHLNKKQYKFLEDKVLAEIERIENKLATDKTHLELNKDSSGRDEVDSANDDILKHTELRFQTRETLYLKKLKKTRRLMLETDEYGLCQDCGSEIGFQRLQARPTSDMCIACKEESERDEFQNFHGRKSKSLGQQINLVGRA